MAESDQTPQIHLGIGLGAREAALKRTVTVPVLMVHTSHCGFRELTIDTKIQCYTYDGNGTWGVLEAPQRALQPRSYCQTYAEERHLC